MGALVLAGWGDNGKSKRSEARPGPVQRHALQDGIFVESLPALSQLTLGRVSPAADGAGADAWPEFRVVILTRSTRHAALILEALRLSGLQCHGVLIERSATGALLRRTRDMWRRRGWRPTVQAMFRQLWSRLNGDAEKWEAICRQWVRAGGVIPSADLTGEDSVERLRELRPDVTVLAGTPLLPASVLEVARLGTLNVHPGLLPRYRGVDVVAHAILNGDPVGATVHFVDAGIDTGRIISRIRVSPGPLDTLASLQKRVDRAGAEELAHVVSRLVHGERIEGEVQSSRFPLCRWLSPDARRRAEARLRGGG
ncbi:MAG TPA: formyl transferase [Gemmatimonadales bacterium]|nr:formyl transferase [Gemmatimonadales bacterium]